MTESQMAATLVKIAGPADYAAIGLVLNGDRFAAWDAARKAALRPWRIARVLRWRRFKVERAAMTVHIVETAGLDEAATKAHPSHAAWAAAYDAWMDAVEAESFAR